MTDAYINGFCKAAEERGFNPEELLKVAGISLKDIDKAIKMLKKPYNSLERFHMSPKHFTVGKDMAWAGLGGGAALGGLGSLLSKTLGGNDRDTNTSVGAGVGALSGAAGTSKFLKHLKPSGASRIFKHNFRNKKIRTLASALALLGGAGLGGVAGGAAGDIVG